MEKKGLDINVPTAIIIAGLFIAGAILLTNGPRANGTGTPAPLPREELRAEPAKISDEDHIYGNKNAKVVMIEYSDTECPFCKLAHPILKQVVDDSQGQVAWVYRHFPLDSLHKKARAEAMATECAAELGGNDVFWNYLNALFETTPSNDGLDPETLNKLARDAGLNLADFKACTESKRYADKVERQFQDGLRIGVTGTPATVVINTKGKSKLVVGALPIEEFRNAIKELK